MNSPNVVDLELSDFWFWLHERQRRALCALVNADADAIARSTWHELATVDRVLLIRGMTELAELAVEAAIALKTARAMLERQASKQ